MSEMIALLLAIVLITAGVVAYCLAVRIVFAAPTRRAEQIVALLPGRSFGIGLVNFLFFGILALIFFGIADSTGVQLLVIPPLLILLGLAVALTVGLAAVARLVGEQLRPQVGDVAQVAIGAAVLTVGSILPFFGWFVLLPYISLVGLGAAILTLFSRQRGERETTQS